MFTNNSEAMINAHITFAETMKTDCELFLAISEGNKMTTVTNIIRTEALEATLCGDGMNPRGDGMNPCGDEMNPYGARISPYGVKTNPYIINN